MEKARTMMSRRNSSLLELEAADYFKLDTCQVGLLTRSNQHLECLNGSRDNLTTTNSNAHRMKLGAYNSTNTSKHKKEQLYNEFSKSNVTTKVQQRQQQLKSSEICHAQFTQAGLYNSSKNRLENQSLLDNKYQIAATSNRSNITSSNERRSNSYLNDKTRVSAKRKQQRIRMGSMADESYHKRTVITREFLANPYQQNEAPEALASLSYMANSSTTSTNSLPSISSSPSVSPSLVCPHLSLDDILQISDKYGAKSPHTIGLCEKCRLDPPPNIQSPLSPAFKPSNTIYSDNQCLPRYDLNSLEFKDPNTHHHNEAIKRGYSDHQVSRHKKAIAKSEQDKLNDTNMDYHRLSSSTDLRNDSLDYFLDPKELRRLQLSPTLRNSVEYIRNNSIEAGRVLKIYQNGKPFDKPLRICICRNEFSNLNHLLDHINTRQLIPSGARYLFHIDGQLVYSVHELKHGSAYFVSGTRNFDVQASNIVKEQLKRETFRQHLPGAQKQSNYNHVIGDQEKIVRSSSNIELKRREAKIPTPGGNVPTLKSSNTKVPTKVAYATSKRGDLKLTSERQDKVSSSLQPMIQERHPSKLSRDYNRLSSTRTVEPAHGLSRDSPNKSDVSNLNSLDYETINFSKSDENLTMDRLVSEGIEIPVTSLVRAKSEMSSSGANKRKKNVTFKDTGRGSSPLISARSVDDSNSKSIDSHPASGRKIEQIPMRKTEGVTQTSPSRVKIESSDVKALNTNEIGIQVNDSIEGYLIDLPLPVPRKRDEDSDTKRVTYLKKGSGVQASSRINATSTSPRRSPKRTTTTVITRQVQDRNSESTSSKTGAGNKKRQIVTISERQLSLDEMDKLKDMDHGDHHSESHKIRRVTIKLESIDDSSNKTEESIETIQEVDKMAKVDSSGSQNVMNDAQNEVRDNNKTTSELHLEGNERHWEYPGGRVASATPTERPVSQSEANEAVHARVITPTPSLSTQDNISLSGSLAARNESQLVESLEGEHRLISRVKLPVLGVMRNGIDLPSRNFQLVWVNGFAINDQYPENSATAMGTQRLVDGSSPTSSASRAGNKNSELLPPSNSNKLGLDNLAQKGPLVFKPNERFHNWICYSNKYDELIYPTGNLIVLWCRWQNEQRYYSKHTSNVSCIALASLDDDLIGSAQLSDANENVNSLIHLWSLDSLETLMVIDQDHFKLLKVFSLKMRNTQSDGCQISVGAKDDKRIWLFRINVKLNDTSKDAGQMGVAKQVASKLSRQQQVVNKLTVIKSEKVLQTNHIPLLIMRMSNAQTALEIAKTSDLKLSKSSTPDDQLDNLVLSFGRRHFQIWSTSQRQEKLRLLQCEHKSAQFIGTIVKANCLARMSPSEYVVGDSDGSINLLMISLVGNKSTTPLFDSSSDLSNVRKYKIETVLLLKPPTSSSGSEQINQGTVTLSPTNKSPSITCLARISGSLFASSDSTCTIKIWRIVRQKVLVDDKKQQEADYFAKSAVMNISSNTTGQSTTTISCSLVSCVTLPSDLGFICSIVLAKYNRRMSLVEFYVSSTSNAILFGSIKLDHSTVQIQDEGSSANMINGLTSFSVVYEGHESSVSSLVADCPSSRASRGKETNTPASANMNEISESYGEYFTCSLDCKICKWSGRNLVWKSVLPSACTSIAAHPIGFVLAIGSGDGTVYILDKISGLLISYFPLTPVCLNCLAYSRDGTFLAAGCANGSIFILPVYERGLKYKKVSIFQSPYPVVSLQFSIDNQFILTSVTHSSYQELILWDLPNFRYMRDNVKMAADKIQWFDAICSGSEDVRAIWENENIASLHEINNNEPVLSKRRLSSKRLSFTDSTTAVVNLSCHRFIPKTKSEEAEAESFAIASDLHGYIRLFRYPCYDIQQGFYETRISSSAVNCCRFLSSSGPNNEKVMFVSSSVDGTICLWTLS